MFADAVDTSTSSILVGELAKLISQNGVKIGQNRLFQWLRDNGYLIKKQGEAYNLPTQRSMDLKIMDIKRELKIIQMAQSELLVQLRLLAKDNNTLLINFNRRTLTPTIEQTN